MRTHYVLTVSGVVMFAVLLVWGGWSVWSLFALEWCPGVDCARYLVSGGGLLFGIAVIAGMAAAAWCFGFYSLIAHRSPVRLGFGAAAVLLPLLFAASDLRSVIAANYFPYVIWFRFGYSGLFLVWTVLSIVGCATIISFAMRRRSARLG